jgi:hypothetical protein
VKQHLQDRVHAISEQIKALETLRSELEGLLSGWQENPPPELISQTICPNIQKQGETARNRGKQLLRASRL